MQLSSPTPTEVETFNKHAPTCGVFIPLSMLPYVVTLVKTAKCLYHGLKHDVMLYCTWLSQTCYQQLWKWCPWCFDQVKALALRCADSCQESVWLHLKPRGPGSQVDALMHQSSLICFLYTISRCLIGAASGCMPTPRFLDRGFHRVFAVCVVNYVNINIVITAIRCS